MKGIEERNGQFWCLRHANWWKSCPCPGDISLSIPITEKPTKAEMEESLGELRRLMDERQRLEYGDWPRITGIQ